MNRRYFTFSFLTTALMQLIGIKFARSAESLDAIINQNSLFTTDCDDYPLILGGRPDLLNSESPLTNTQMMNELMYLPYEAVTKHLSLFLEEKFQTFIFVNTATRSDEDELVPHQHLVIVNKINPHFPLFVRDTDNVVLGFTENAEESELIPISSGKGSPHLLTYSGIFRINHVVTKGRVGTNESEDALMSWSSYIDFVYRGGREARVAIHGTPPKNHHLLGKRRASEGCLRTLPEIAKRLRAHLLSPQMWSNDLPRFERSLQIPSEATKNGEAGSAPGIKALVIVFNGFETINA